MAISNAPEHPLVHTTSVAINGLLIVEYFWAIAERVSKYPVE